MFNQCCAAINPNERKVRCLFKGEQKYCEIHLALANVVDHHFTEYDCIDEKNVDRVITNEAPFGKWYGEEIRIPDIQSTTKSLTALIEAKDQSELDIQTKLLILLNEKKYHERIAELVGPVFNNPCLSHDSEDPISGDIIWTDDGNGRQPTDRGLQSHFLFSYYDSDTLRCLSIYTIEGMIKKMKRENDSSLINPVTMTPLSIEARDRAIKLCELYRKKLGLFNLHKLCQSDIQEMYQEWLSDLASTGYRIPAKWYIDLNRRSIINLFSTTRDILGHIKGLVLENHFFLSSSKKKKSSNRLKMLYLRTWKTMHLEINAKLVSLFTGAMLQALSNYVPQVQELFPGIVG
jgi:hypothetical protein